MLSCDIFRFPSVSPRRICTGRGQGQDQVDPFRLASRDPAYSGKRIDSIFKCLRLLDTYQTLLYVIRLIFSNYQECTVHPYTLTILYTYRWAFQNSFILTQNTDMLTIYLYVEYLPICRLSTYMSTIYLYVDYLPICRLSTYMLNIYLYVDYLPTYMSTFYLYVDYLPIC